MIVLPSRETATSAQPAAGLTSESAVPITPASSRTLCPARLLLLRIPESGRKVALPAFSRFRISIRRLAVSSSFVTIFCILPPRATSIAVSYFFSVEIRSATVPTMPGSRDLSCMTRFTLPPKPSYRSARFTIASSFDFS